jgi:hypothetical protein
MQVEIRAEVQRAEVARKNVERALQRFISSGRIDGAALHDINSGMAALRMHHREIESITRD